MANWTRRCGSVAKTCWFYERLGERGLVIGLANLGTLLVRRGLPADLQEARARLERAAAMTAAMLIPFPDHLQHWLKSSARRT